MPPRDDITILAARMSQPGVIYSREAGGLEIGSWNLGVEIWELAAGAGQGAVRSAVHRPSACASPFARPWPELPSSQPASDDGGRADHGGTSRTHVPIRLRRAAVSREGSDGRPMTVEWRRCCCATAP